MTKLKIKRLKWKNMKVRESVLHFYLIIILEGGGQDCILWDKLKSFSVYTHTKNFFGGHPPAPACPRLCLSLTISVFSKKQLTLCVTLWPPLNFWDKNFHSSSFSSLQSWNSHIKGINYSSSSSWSNELRKFFPSWALGVVTLFHSFLF